MPEDRKRKEDGKKELAPGPISFPLTGRSSPAPREDLPVPLHPEVLTTNGHEFTRMGLIEYRWVSDAGGKRDTASISGTTSYAVKGPKFV
jgi:hypothetical protein